MKCDTCICYVPRTTPGTTTGRCRRFPVETQKSKESWCLEHSPRVIEPGPVEPRWVEPGPNTTDEELELITAPDGERVS